MSLERPSANTQSEKNPKEPQEKKQTLEELLAEAEAKQPKPQESLEAMLKREEQRQKTENPKGLSELMSSEKLMDSFTEKKIQQDLSDPEYTSSNEDRERFTDHMKIKALTYLGIGDRPGGIDHLHTLLKNKGMIDNSASLVQEKQIVQKKVEKTIKDYVNKGKPLDEQLLQRAVFKALENHPFDFGIQFENKLTNEEADIWAEFTAAKDVMLYWPRQHVIPEFKNSESNQK